MPEFILVFRSRTQATDANAVLGRVGVPCRLINTPKDIGVGCGFSVVVAAQDLNRAWRTLSARRYSALYGAFRRQQTPRGMRWVRV